MPPRTSFISNDPSAVPARFQSALDLLQTLQFKATTLVVGLTLVIVGAVSGYLLQSSGRLAKEQTDAQIVNAASVLAKAASGVWDIDSPKALQDLARQSANGVPLLYAVFTDPTGKVVANAEHRNVGVFRRIRRVGDADGSIAGAPVSLPTHDETAVFLEVTYPVARRDEAVDSSGHAAELLGYVRTGMVANSWQRSMAGTIDLLIGVGAVALAVAIPLGFLLVRRIVSPLDDLAESMREFSEGKLHVRSPVVRRDEIGRLALAFNRMADQHQRTHDRIVRLNAELEERVAYRTQQLRELAAREPLTGLYNRRHFNEMLERRLAEAARYDSDLTCIMIDLDGFKDTNDAFGHQVGDELLVLTASTIVGQLRSPDIAARVGGDEFVILLPQTDADRAKVLCERIMERFARDTKERFPKIRCSMSMGIASLQSLETKDADSLVRAADNAMYEAKSSGKNTVVIACGLARPAL